MELVHETRKASKFAPEDVISNMPDIVITHILDRLPLQDAVRTGILSRNWRSKWTMISQLILDYAFLHFIETQGEDSQGENSHVEVIDSILVQLRGAITKFVIWIDEFSDIEDIDNWILFLSRKGIKDINVEYGGYTPLKLPTHLFSCFELRRLKLRNCYFNPPPTFSGFPNLLSLNLCVEFEKNIQLGDFFTRCPLLEKLAMDDLFEFSKVSILEIAKVENLKILYLRFFDDDEIATTSCSTIFELLGSLPKLQELCLDFEECELIEGNAKRRFSTSFPSLKALKLSRICLDNSMKLSFAFELIRSSPNLLTLEIVANDSKADSPPEIDYDTTEALQLRSVAFECLNGSKNGLRLIKYLLACSPFLKRIVIWSRSELPPDEKLMFVAKLLKFHRASPVAEIDLFSF